MKCHNVSVPEYGCSGQTCVSCYSIPNNNVASYVCSMNGGTCQEQTCNPGFVDCVGDLKTCQTNVNTNSMNCGSCGHDCSASGTAPPNGTHALATGCVMGNCRITQCEAGFADCDLATTNGCELMLAGVGGGPGLCCPDTGACPAAGCQACAGGKTCNTTTNPVRPVCK
jgi:hypothetical protein